MSKLFVIVNFQNIFCQHSLSDERYPHAAYAIYNKVESLLRYTSSEIHKNNAVICIYEGDYDQTEFHESYFYKRFSDKNIRLSQSLCNLTYKTFDEIEVCGMFTDQSVLKYLLLLKEKFPDVKMIVDLQCCTDISVRADTKVLTEMQKHGIEIIDKKYVCPKCGKSFAYAYGEGSYQRHMSFAEQYKYWSKRPYVRKLAQEIILCGIALRSEQEIAERIECMMHWDCFDKKFKEDVKEYALKWSHYARYEHKGSFPLFFTLQDYKKGRLI